MPVCKYNPQQNLCEYDPNLYWGGLDQESRMRCKQQLDNCGEFIAIPQPPQQQPVHIGGKRRRHRTSKRKLRRRLTRRRR